MRTNSQMKLVVFGSRRVSGGEKLYRLTARTWMKWQLNGTRCLLIYIYRIRNCECASALCALFGRHTMWNVEWVRARLCVRVLVCVCVCRTRLCASVCRMDGPTTKRNDSHIESVRRPPYGDCARVFHLSGETKRWGAERTPNDDMTHIWHIRWRGSPFDVWRWAKK